MQYRIQIDWCLLSASNLRVLRSLVNHATGMDVTVTQVCGRNVTDSYVVVDLCDGSLTADEENQTRFLAETVGHWLTHATECRLAFRRRWAWRAFVFAVGCILSTTAHAEYNSIRYGSADWAAQQQQMDSLRREQQQLRDQMEYDRTQNTLQLQEYENSARRENERARDLELLRRENE